MLSNNISLVPIAPCNIQSSRPLELDQVLGQLGIMKPDILQIPLRLLMPNEAVCDASKNLLAYGAIDSLREVSRMSRNSFQARFIPRVRHKRVPKSPESYKSLNWHYKQLRLLRRTK